MTRCEIDNCSKKAVGEILVAVTGENDPWYISVCQKHLNVRKQKSPDGKPIVDGYPQWKEYE